MNITIIIQGGLIQEIFSNSQTHIDINIIDLDIIEDQELDNMRDHYNKAVNDKTLHVIY